MKKQIHQNEQYQIISISSIDHNQQSQASLMTDSLFDRFEKGNYQFNLHINASRQEIYIKQMRDIQCHLKKIQQNYKKRKIAYQQFSFEVSQCHDTIFQMYHTVSKQKEQLKNIVEESKRQIDRLITQKKQFLEKIDQMNQKQETSRIMYTKLLKKITKNNGIYQSETSQDYQQIEVIKEQYQNVFKQFQSKSNFKKKQQAKDIGDKLRLKFYGIYSKLKQMCCKSKQKQQKALNQLQKLRHEKEMIQKQRQMECQLKEKEYRQKLQIQSKCKKYEYLFEQKQKQYKRDREIMKKIFDNHSNIIQRYEVLKIKNYYSIFDELYQNKPQWSTRKDNSYYSKEGIYHFRDKLDQEQNIFQNPQINKKQRQKKIEQYIIEIKQNFSKMQAIIFCLIRTFSDGKKDLDFGSESYVFYDKTQYENEGSDIMSDQMSSHQNSTMKIF